MSTEGVGGAATSVDLGQYSSIRDMMGTMDGCAGGTAWMVVAVRDGAAQDSRQAAAAHEQSPHMAAGVRRESTPQRAQLGSPQRKQ